MKYSKSLLEPLVKDSTSTSEVLRKLGKTLSGGNNSHLKRLFKKFGIDTSHFLGQASNRGKVSPDKIPWQNILVFDRLKGRRENVYRLKRAMLESGIPEKCAICGLSPEWNGQQLVLQIDHVDGCGVNNLQHNVRFLCPNCHSQTPTFGIKNRKQLTAIEEIQRQEDREFFKALKKAANI